MDCVVFGSGGLARGFVDAADAEGRLRVLALADLEADPRRMVLGRPVWGEEEILSGKGPAAGLVAIGDNYRREMLVKRIAAARPDFRFLTVVHPRAYVAPTANLGDGTVVMPGAVVAPCAKVGQHVVLYSNTVVEHDDVLADFVTLAPAAALGGNVRLGERTFVGMGAVVIHDIELGPDTIVAAQAAVIADHEGSCVLAGTPARCIKRRPKGDPYL